LTIWVIYTAVSIWGASEVKIEFKSTYFIGEGAYVKDFLDRQEEYFESGIGTTIYTELGQDDISTYEK